MKTKTKKFLKKSRAQDGVQSRKLLRGLTDEIFETQGISRKNFGKNNGNGNQSYGKGSQSYGKGGKGVQKGNGKGLNRKALRKQARTEKKQLKGRLSSKQAQWQWREDALKSEESEEEVQKKDVQKKAAQKSKSGTNGLKGKEGKKKSGGKDEDHEHESDDEISSDDDAATTNKTSSDKTAKKKVHTLTHAQLAELQKADTPLVPNSTTEEYDRMELHYLEKMLGIGGSKSSSSTFTSDTKAKQASRSRRQLKRELDTDGFDDDLFSFCESIAGKKVPKELAGKKADGSEEEGDGSEKESEDRDDDDNMADEGEGDSDEEGSDDDDEDSYEQIKMGKDSKGDDSDTASSDEDEEDDGDNVDEEEDEDPLNAEDLADLSDDELERRCQAALRKKKRQQKLQNRKKKIEDQKQLDQNRLTEEQSASADSEKSEEEMDDGEQNVKAESDSESSSDSDSTPDANSENFAKSLKKFQKKQTKASKKSRSKLQDFKLTEAEAQEFQYLEDQLGISRNGDLESARKQKKQLRKELSSDGFDFDLFDICDSVSGQKTFPADGSDGSEESEDGSDEDSEGSASIEVEGEDKDEGEEEETSEEEQESSEEELEPLDTADLEDLSDAELEKRCQEVLRRKEMKQKKELKKGQKAAKKAGGLGASDFGMPSDLGMPSDSISPAELEELRYLEDQLGLSMKETGGRRKQQKKLKKEMQEDGFDMDLIGMCDGISGGKKTFGEEEGDENAESEESEEESDEKSEEESGEKSEEDGEESEDVESGKMEVHGDDDDGDSSTGSNSDESDESDSDEPSAKRRKIDDDESNTKSQQLQEEDSNNEDKKPSPPTTPAPGAWLPPHLRKKAEAEKKEAEEKKLAAAAKKAGKDVDAEKKKREAEQQKQKLMIKLRSSCNKVSEGNLDPISKEVLTSVKELLRLTAASSDAEADKNKDHSTNKDDTTNTSVLHLANSVANIILEAACDNQGINVLVVCCYAAIIVAVSVEIDSLFAKVIVNKLENRVLDFLKFNFPESEYSGRCDKTETALILLSLMFYFEVLPPTIPFGIFRKLFEGVAEEGEGSADQSKKTNDQSKGETEKTEKPETKTLPKAASKSLKRTPAQMECCIDLALTTLRYSGHTLRTEYSTDFRHILDFLLSCKGKISGDRMAFLITELEDLKKQQKGGVQKSGFAVMLRFEQTRNWLYHFREEEKNVGGTQKELANKKTDKGKKGKKSGSEGDGSDKPGFGEKAATRIAQKPNDSLEGHRINFDKYEFLQERPPAEGWFVLENGGGEGVLRKAAKLKGKGVEDGEGKTIIKFLRFNMSMYHY